MWGLWVARSTVVSGGPRAVLPSAAAGHGDLLAVDATGRLLRYPWVSDGTFGVPQPVADGFADVTALVAGHFTGPAGAVQLLAVRKDGSGHLYGFDAAGKAVDQGAVTGPQWKTFTRLTAGAFTAAGQEQLVGIDAAGHAQLITFSLPAAGGADPAKPATPAPTTATTAPAAPAGGAAPAGAAVAGAPAAGAAGAAAAAGAAGAAPAGAAAPAAAAAAKPAFTATLKAVPQNPTLAGAVTIEAVPGIDGVDQLASVDGTGRVATFTFTAAQGFVPVKAVSDAPGAPAGHAVPAVPTVRLPAAVTTPVTAAFAGSDPEILVTGADGQSWIVSLTHPDRPAQGAAFQSDAALPATQPAQGQHRLSQPTG